MIFPKQTKSRQGISTNGTDPEEFKQKYCMNEVRTKAPVCLKRKYSVNSENCLPQEMDKALQKV